MSKKLEVKSPSVLAFERRFDISDGIFLYLDSEGVEQGIPVTKKSIRGTISNRLKNAIKKDPLKIDAEVEKPNLQKDQVAMLDADYERYLFRWSLKVLPFEGRPSICNETTFQDRVMAVTDEYIKEHGFSELAKRYAINIINARWLWRNRMASNDINIHINYRDEKGKPEKPLEFRDAKQYSLNTFDVKNDEQLSTLTKLIEKGLSGEQFVILEITADAFIGKGQEVYPSQELILDKAKDEGKELYQVNGKAAMHSQKIGNALRTIDDWYSDAEFPVAVEPYASVTTLGTAFRKPSDKNPKDFYTLFDNWMLKDEAPELDQQHYVIAVLIRGGVFGGAD